MSTNPLVLAYQVQLCRHTSVARWARRLLITCIHEAGHLVGYAHFGVPVVNAMVDRRPKHIGAGIVVPTDSCGFVPAGVEGEDRVDYVCTLAGPRAEYLVTGTAEAEDGGTADRLDAQEVLDRVCGADPFVQGEREAYWGAELDAIIGAKWAVIEAFAYELMRKGQFLWGDFADVEARYGVGYGARNLSAAQQASARRRLAAFHAKPEELVQAIRAIRA